MVGHVETNTVPTKIAAYIFIGLTMLVALKACGAQWIPKLWTDMTLGEQDYMEPLMKWTPAVGATIDEDHDSIDSITDAVLETAAVGAIKTGISRYQQQQRLWEIVIGVPVLITLLSMWVWVATDLNWKIERIVTVGDNVTYDSARNFYVFGYLIIGWALAILIGILFSLRANAKAKQRQELISSIEQNKFNEMREREMGNFVPKDVLDSDDDDVWLKFLNDHVPEFSSEQNTEENTDGGSCWCWCCAQFRTRQNQPNSEKIKIWKDNFLERNKSQKAISRTTTADVNDDPTPIPSSRFLDATDDAFPSDEEYTLDIDMEQRGIDYTGAAGSSAEQETLLVTPQSRSNSYGSTQENNPRPVSVPLQPVLQKVQFFDPPPPLDVDYDSDEQPNTNTGIPEGKRTHQLHVTHEEHHDIEILPGYTIEWEFKMQPQSQGMDVDFVVQVVSDVDNKPIKDTKTVGSIGSDIDGISYTVKKRRQFAKGDLNFDEAEGTWVERAYTLRLCFDNSFSNWYNKDLEVEWKRVPNEDGRKMSADANNTDEELPQPTMGTMSV